MYLVTALAALLLATRSRFLGGIPEPIRSVRKPKPCSNAAFGARGTFFMGLKRSARHSVTVIGEMSAHAMLNTLGAPQGDEAEGKYRILAELGEGGTAIVYLAVARGPSGFNKLVVLKTLKRALLDDPDLRKMFMQEARVAARLNHPCIVQTYEVFDEDGLPVIVMEYLEGQPLSKVIRRGAGKFTLPMHLRVIAEALNGLQHAHELADFDGTPLGLVHRDMTPHNLFLTFEGQTKLLDFGIAKLTTSHPETQTGVIKGKLRYMPPEQITGEPLDRRADIYAIGVMLWEAAAGQEMWQGMSDATIMHRVVNGELPSLRSANPETSEELERICMKALSPEMSDRYATAVELETELESVLQKFDAPPNNRAIGKIVSNLFTDVRAHTKSLIEARLSKVASLSWEEYAATEAPALTTLQTGSVLGSNARRVVRARPWFLRTGTLFGLTALALLGTLSFMLFRGSNAPATPRAIPSALGTVRSSAPVLPPAPTQISVRIAALPPESKLFLDDEPLPTNPYMRIMAADGSLHIVRAQAPGHTANMSAFEANRDADVTLNLQRLKAASDIPNAPRPIIKSTPSVTKPRPNLDCSPPYYIDREGTKKFKLECL
jgi:eukaryotic-like serine/threonine-protein kinase